MFHKDQYLDHLLFKVIIAFKFWFFSKILVVMSQNLLVFHLQTSNTQTVPFVIWKYKPWQQMQEFVFHQKSWKDDKSLCARNQLIPELIFKIFCLSFALDCAFLVL